MRWSTVWSPSVQMHSGDCIILNLWRDAFVFPCAVIIAVRLGVRLIFLVDLSVISGRPCFTSNSSCSASVSSCLGFLNKPQPFLYLHQFTVLFHTTTHYWLHCGWDYQTLTFCAWIKCPGYSDKEENLNYFKLNYFACSWWHLLAILAP